MMNSGKDKKLKVGKNIAVKHSTWEQVRDVKTNSTNMTNDKIVLLGVEKARHVEAIELSTARIKGYFKAIARYKYAKSGKLWPVLDKITLTAGRKSQFKKIYIYSVDYAYEEKFLVSYNHHEFRRDRKKFCVKSSKFIAIEILNAFYKTEDNWKSLLNTKTKEEYHGPRHN